MRRRYLLNWAPNLTRYNPAYKAMCSPGRPAKRATGITHDIQKHKETTMKQLAIRLLAPLLMVCLLTAAPLQAQNGGVPSSLNGLDGFVEQVMNDWHVPGLAVAIVK